MTDDDAQPKQAAQPKPRPPPRTFPRVSLERALALTAAIKDKNAGNPWEPKFVAKEVGIKHKSSRFSDLITAGRLYGLIAGKYQGKSLQLEAIGRGCAYPASPADEQVAKERAFLNVQPFADVLDYYKGSQLPEMIYLSNVLETHFNIPVEYHDEFVKIFKENCRFLGIGAQYKPASTNGVKGSPPTVKITNKAAPQSPAPNGGVTCFVIMPFVEREEVHPPGFFTEVFRSLIQPACESLGYKVKTAKRQGSDVIQSTIVNELLDADLVIADLTEHNPNVLFELGMRMAEDKPVALIRASGTGKIFDVDNLLRVLDYNPVMWPTSVAEDVPKIAEHVRAAWEHRDHDQSYMKLLRNPVIAANVASHT